MTLMSMLESARWWHWWATAAVLAAVETFIPGAVAIWFAASAFVVGLLMLLVPIPLGWQLVLFGALGIVAVVLYRRYARTRAPRDEQPLLNQRGAQYIGHQLTLAEPIRNGAGRAHVGDSVWTVEGPDLPRGAHVRVVGVHGTALVVEPAARA